MKVAYLGAKGSFTYDAASSVFKSAELIPYKTILSAFRSIEEAKVDFAVLPIENATEGTVNQTLDFMYHQATVPIQAEIILPIKQQFMVHPKWAHEWKNILSVKSHPQALAQTQQFLEDNFHQINQEATESTTEAAQWLHNHPDEKVGAIASKEAASTYRLTIIQSNIQDIEHNETRFWVIGRNKLAQVDHLEKTKRKSIGVYFTENKPGNLHKILSVFSWRTIDLTKIESRPLRTQLGEYYFLIDINNTQPELVNLAIREIESLGGIIKELGEYSVYKKDSI